jgi:hypothetical protein
MALFQSTPYIIYSDTRFTSDNFGLAWGDVDGDGINELLVSPANITGVNQPIFLTFNGTTFVTKNIVVSDGGFLSNSDAGFAIFDIDNDGQNEVIQNLSSGIMKVYKWRSDINMLVKYSDITGTSDNVFDNDISMVRINNQNYIFEAIDQTSIRIYALNNYTATPVYTIVNPIAGGGPNDGKEVGVDIRDIDCDGRLEMAVSGGNPNNRLIKFFRLMNPSDVTSWSDLNSDLTIQNTGNQPETVVFANLECPNRWDVVVTTSVGSAPADILVYRNITCGCKGISDFQLKTADGLLISDRVCCKDDIVASWVVNCPASACSDTVGFIQLSDPCGTVITHPLTKNATNYTFSVNDCCPGAGRLTFFRRCSDGCSDSFTRPLTFFKTTVNAGTDQSILFGATATLGSGASEPHTVYQWICDIDGISDVNSLHTTARPCVPGSHTYTVKAYDNEFPNCSDSGSVQVNVSTPIIYWSDIGQSDRGTTCTFSGVLLSSDTYTNWFHIVLKNLATGSDVVDTYGQTPYFFSDTVQKPAGPGVHSYTLTATLSDFEGCPFATTPPVPFLCIKPPTTIPGGPSTFEMLFRLFGFLILSILFGLIFYDRQEGV